MSTRWYPVFRKGNPQLRVFLPNMWMKVVKSKAKRPPNMVEFITSNEMTDYDIRNYLEKIYNLPVVNVTSNIQEGEFTRDHMKGYVKKEDDYRRAIVTLRKGEVFEFPDICKERQESQESEYTKIKQQTKESYDNARTRSHNRTGLPTWLRI